MQSRPTNYFEILALHSPLVIGFFIKIQIESIISQLFSKNDYVCKNFAIMKIPICFSLVSNFDNGIVLYFARHETAKMYAFCSALFTTLQCC